MQIWLWNCSLSLEKRMDYVITDELFFSCPLYALNTATQYAKQESNEVERYSKTEIAAPLYDP